MDRLFKNRKAIVEVLKKDYVQEIWLFGSYAYGVPDESSDFDLLVVTDQGEDTIEHFSILNFALLQLLANQHIAHDLILVDEKGKQMYKDDKNMVYYHAFHEGYRLYSRDRHVCIVGDLHGDRTFFEEHLIKDNDIMIAVGDFCFIYRDNEDEHQYLDYLASKDYTIYFIDGNHDNMDALEKYPIVKKCGGRMHKIRDNIYHMLRGEIYNVDNHIIFTMGGAFSMDRHCRSKGYSWWEQELPTEQQLLYGLKNLEKYHYEVDYIITHTAPKSIIIQEMNMIPTGKDQYLIEYFDMLKDKVKFKRWYYGHFHRDLRIKDKYFCLWYKVKYLTH